MMRYHQQNQSKNYNQRDHSLHKSKKDSDTRRNTHTQDHSNNGGKLLLLPQVREFLTWKILHNKEYFYNLISYLSLFLFLSYFVSLSVVPLSYLTNLPRHPKNT